MPSAVIRSGRSYPAVPLAGQLVHQRSVRPGPLVLGTTPLNSPTPTADRDRTVSRRSEPSSRTALMGEQPNPWDRLQPQSNYPPDTVHRPVSRRGVRSPRHQGWYLKGGSTRTAVLASQPPTYPEGGASDSNIKL